MPGETTSEAEPLVYGPTVLVLAARIAAHASTTDDPWTMETWRLAREVLEQEEKAARSLADALGVNEVNLYALMREAARRLQAAEQLRAELARLEDWQNSIASRVPESYDDDVAQEAIIGWWLDDLIRDATAYRALMQAANREPAGGDQESTPRDRLSVVTGADVSSPTDKAPTGGLDTWEF